MMYYESYVPDSPRYDDNNYYSTINQEYQHPQQQQANQNIHQEIKYVHTIKNKNSLKIRKFLNGGARLHQTSQK